jgi:uncharacterized protein YcbX
MQGERLASSDVTEQGLSGDRSWALLDERTGVYLTARREPQLLFASARLDGDAAPRITLDDGTSITDDATLSAWLGHPVRLVPASASVHGTFEIALSIDDEEHAEWVSWEGPSGRFHDSAKASVSLVTEASLRDWDVRRFRMNVIADGDGEDALVGARLRIGTAEIDVQKQINRCVMTTRPQPDGIERDLTVLKTINAELGGSLGIGGLVATPGRVSIGDEIVRIA